MKRLATGWILALVLQLGGIAPIWAKEATTKASSCASEDIDVLLGNVARLATEQKLDELIDQCFPPKSLERIAGDPEPRANMKQLMAKPDFVKGVLACKEGDARPTADGKAAVCQAEDPSTEVFAELNGACYELDGKTWYLCLAY